MKSELNLNQIFSKTETELKIKLYFWLKFSLDFEKIIYQLSKIIACKISLQFNEIPILALFNEAINWKLSNQVIFVYKKIK